MHNDNHIQEYANSSARQLVQKQISAKYRSRQIKYVNMCYNCFMNMFCISVFFAILKLSWTTKKLQTLSTSLQPCLLLVQRMAPVKRNAMFWSEIKHLLSSICAHSCATRMYSYWLQTENWNIYWHNIRFFKKYILWIFCC